MNFASGEHCDINQLLWGTHWPPPLQSLWCRVKTAALNTVALCGPWTARSLVLETYLSIGSEEVTLEILFAEKLPQELSRDGVN